MAASRNLWEIVEHESVQLGLSWALDHEAIHSVALTPFPIMNTTLPSSHVPSPHFFGARVTISLRASPDKLSFDVKCMSERLQITARATNNIGVALAIKPG